MLPKSVTKKRITENYKASELSLSEQDIKDLQNLDKDLRLFKLSSFFQLPSEDELWDVAEDEAYKM